MQFNQRFGEGKTQASALNGLGVLAFDLDKGLTQSVKVTFGNAYACVLHRNLDLITKPSK